MWPFKKKKQNLESFEYTDEEKKIIDKAKSYTGIISSGPIKITKEKSS